LQVPDKKEIVARCVIIVFTANFLRNIKMHTEPYSTSMEEIFTFLYQGLASDNTLQKASHEETASNIQEEWLIQLEEAFRTKGLKFTYSIKPSETTFHNDGGHPHYATSDSLYTFEVER